MKMCDKSLSSYGIGNVAIHAQQPPTDHHRLETNRLVGLLEMLKLGLPATREMWLKAIATTA